MSQLIKKLRRDHLEISDLFRNTAQCGVTTEEGQAKLRDAKTTLLTHLQKEDDELYPALWEMAKTNYDLKQKLELFEKDLGDVSKVVFAFFEKYEGAEHGGDFQRDFRKVYVSLTKRINNEERDLFPEYLRFE